MSPHSQSRTEAEDPSAAPPPPLCIPEFALSPSMAASGGNPQEMTPRSNNDTIPISKDKLKKMLEAEYGEVDLDDDEFDENADMVDEELEDESAVAGSDDENSLVDPHSNSDKTGVCGSCGDGKNCTKEEAASFATVTFWLLFWLLNNIGLTLLNKATFASYDFKYPFFLSFFHMACNYLGGEITLWLAARRNADKGEYAPLPLSSGGGSDADLEAKKNRLRRSKSLVLDGLTRGELDRSGQLKMWAFSVIFSLNIAIGNVSLRYVSVNFNQVMRSLVPAVAIVFGYCLGKSTSTRRKLAVVPVIGGVAMACYGEMELTVVGFVFTSLCVVLAALKAVAAGEILTGELKLHPVDLLNKMAPKAALQCLLLSLATGELHSIASRWNAPVAPLNPLLEYHPALGVVSTGIMSFSLNISSLMSNKLTSPLTLCIAANVKQVLMIGMATVIFQTPISALNGGGIGVVLVGSAIYSCVSLMEKQQAAKTKSDEGKIVEVDAAGGRPTKKSVGGKTVRITTGSEDDDEESWTGDSDEEDEEEALIASAPR